MKKFAALCLAAVLMLGVGACTPKEEVAVTPSEDAVVETSEDVVPSEEITELEELVIGLDDQFPPMGFRDDAGEIIGFDIDLAVEACARMGYKPVFQPIDWSTKEIELSSGNVDMLWNGLTITDARKEVMLFTAPYIQNVQIIVTKADSGLATKADLADKKIGLQAASSALDAVQADADTFAAFAAIEEYENNVLAFADLEIGRVDAVVVDSIVGYYYIQENGADFVVLEENFGDEDYGVAVRLDETELGDALQAALNDMIADGTAAEISNKWFNEDIMVK